MSLSLNCLIQGDDPEKMFTVEIEKTENVSILRDLIKKKKAPHLDHVDASELVLWKVDLDMDEFEAKPVNLELKLSPPILKLSSFFDHVMDDQRLHIIAVAPERALYTTQRFLSLNCLILGDDPRKAFTVNIEKTENVCVLRDLIKKKKSPHLDHVDAKYLDLWKVNLDMDEVRAKPVNLELNLSPPYLKLSSFFDHVMDNQRVHIIAVAPGKEERRDRIYSLNIRFQNTVTSFLKATPSGDSATSSSIYDGRYKENEPRTRVAPPIQLFHPVFGHFLDDIKSSGPIPDDMICHTLDYMKSASAIYASEDERRVELSPLLYNILGVDVQSILNEDKTRHKGIPLVLKEDKNEFGVGGSDPSKQFGLSVGRCWAQSRFEKLRLSTNCPTFLIATAGPWVAILGAVFTDDVIVQRLTDYVWVGLDTTSYESHITNVARIFYALKTNLERLKLYYEKVQPTGDLSLGSRYFPSITAYRHENEVIHFEYVGFLENDPDCVILRARTKTGPAQDIVVKFVDRYGEKAHRLLADEDLAPEIIFCGSPHLDIEQPSYGSISMVVMEYIDGETLAKAKPNLNKEMIMIVRSELQKALKLLHDHGLVFGDLRSPNVMITKAKQVKLIDFDWAGEEGKTKYPYLISSAIDWPANVKALAVMQRAHDLDMLNRLFST